MFILLIMNLSDKIKQNDKVDKFIKDCKQMKPSKEFLVDPPSMGYSRKYLGDTCADCNEYDHLTKFNGLDRNINEWNRITHNLLLDCIFIEKHDKEIHRETPKGIIDLKNLLVTIKTQV